MRVLGVDEHVRRHTSKPDKYVTFILDLTPIRDGTRPLSLLDMVEGRSKQALMTWLADQLLAWRDAVEVVAMDGSTGFKTATTEELPSTVAVMDDPFTSCGAPATSWTVQTASAAGHLRAPGSHRRPDVRLPTRPTLHTGPADSPKSRRTS